MSAQKPEPKLLRGTTDHRTFEDLGATKPGFLALTGKQIRLQFSQFEPYPTFSINQALANLRRRHKEKYETDKKLRDQGAISAEELEPTDIIPISEIEELSDEENKGVMEKSKLCACC